MPITRPLGDYRDFPGRMGDTLSKEVSYTYDYPKGLSLKPGTPRHDKLRDMLYERAFYSHKAIEARFPSWRAMDRTLTAYMPIDSAEREIINEDSRKPVSIVVPVSYAVLDTLLTYCAATFLNDPIFRYQGQGPEDMVGASLLEKMISLQTKRMKTALALTTMWRDGLVYGTGSVALDWYAKYGKRLATPSERERALGVKPNLEHGMLFEGNRLQNIDPYLSLPDINMPCHRQQDGDGYGWVNRTSFMSLLSDEVDQKTYFNVRYIRHVDGRSSLFVNDDDDRDKYNVEGHSTLDIDSATKPVDVIYMYVTLIPKDWGLSNSPNPEKWSFALAGDDIIIKAQPLDLAHNMYPIATCVPDSDGYSVSPISRLETVYGLQHALSWYMSSHITNVRKVMYSTHVVDPSMINMEDYFRPSSGGKCIRLRQAAWGGDISKGIMQLPVQDATSNHMGDSASLMMLIKQFTGAVDSMQGVTQRTGERVSAQEASDVHTSAMSRLGRLATMMSLTAMEDIGYMFASHTQQFMTEGQYVDLSLGEWPEAMAEVFQDQRRAYVSSADLNVNYDVLPYDGTFSPGGNLNTLAQLYQMSVSDPEVRQRLDIPRLFMRIAQMAGVSNIQSFLRRDMQATVMPDEQVASEAAKGNMVPIQ